MIRLGATALPGSSPQTLHVAAAASPRPVCGVPAWRKCRSQVEDWKRKQSRHAMEWGAVGFEDVEGDRPEFAEDALTLVTNSPVDGMPTTSRPGGCLVLDLLYPSRGRQQQSNAAKMSSNGARTAETLRPLAFPRRLRDRALGRSGPSEYPCGTPRRSPMPQK